MHKESARCCRGRLTGIAAGLGLWFGEQEDDIVAPTPREIARKPRGAPNTPRGEPVEPIPQPEVGNPRSPQANHRWPLTKKHPARHHARGTERARREAGCCVIGQQPEIHNKETPRKEEPGLRFGLRVGALGHEDRFFGGCAVRRLRLGVGRGPCVRLLSPVAATPPGWRK